MTDYIPVVSNPTSTQSGSPTWTEYTPAGSHTHPESEITNLVSDLAGKAASSHTHNASDVNAGTLGIARIPTGASSTTVCIGDDARLSDSRTPLTHSITAAHNGFPGGTSNFLRADGTFAAPTSQAGDADKPGTGALTVTTAKYHVSPTRHQATGSQRITVAGTGRLRIPN